MSLSTHSSSSLGTSESKSKDRRRRDAAAADDDEEDRASSGSGSSSRSSDDDSVVDAELEAKLFRVTENDLEQYLHDMRLDGLFSEMVEELLVDAPANPVQYLIDLLFTKYPDQAMDSSFAKTFPDAMNAVGGGVPLTGLRHASVGLDAVAEAVKEEADSDDEDDEDFKARDAASAEASMPLLHRVETRRGALAHHDGASGPETPAPLLEDGEAAALAELLRGDMLFREMSGVQVLGVARHFSARRGKQDEVLYKEGRGAEEDGGCFFVVEAGECAHHVGGVKVSHCKRGRCMGHAALLYRAAPQTTVTVASEEARLYCISRRRYKAAMRAVTEGLTDAAVELLATVDLFRETLTEVEMRRLAEDVASRHTYAAGDILVHQHKPADSMFLIVRGAATCEQRFSPSEPPAVVAEFTKGDWFGEIGLVADRPRAASVTATSPVECLEVHRDRFLRVFGPLTELLRVRNLPLFKRFISDKI